LRPPTGAERADAGFFVGRDGTSLALSTLSPSFLHTRRPGLRWRDRVFSFLEPESFEGHVGCIEEDVEGRQSAVAL
jgi:hypothetical protein